MSDILTGADALVLTAGAGMGVDSGLPDFRGPQGFWRTYPALGRAGLRFEDIANPRAFHDDPLLAWGFYGHRLRLYRNTRPHAGFALLLGLSKGYPHGSFVFTSNVDGQFQKAGFPDERIVECHGSIHLMQCLEGCCEDLWSSGEFDPVVDEESGRLVSALPLCPRCEGLARPGILMFGDGGWSGQRTLEQEERFRQWRSRVSRPVVIEIGAGTIIPSVRHFGEAQDAPLIRINLREWQTTRAGDIGLGMSSREGIDALVREIGDKIQ